jgi:GNAT superfamily N-acetyltransferase
MIDKPVIREYQDADFQHLAICMESLQQYMVNIDPYGLNICRSWFWEAYAEKTLKKVSWWDWKIFCAFSNDKMIWCIAWVIEEAESDNLSDPAREYISKKSGETLELIIMPESRGTGVWKLLIGVMENYFRSQGCEYATLGVFGTNTNAREFYEKQWYSDRLVVMSKPL